MADRESPNHGHVGQPGAAAALANGNRVVNGNLGALNSTPKSVKRPRPVKSCIECRKRKLRCDRNLPCTQCQKSQRACRYAADGDVGNLSEDSENETLDRPAKRPCSAPQQADSPARPSVAMFEEWGTRLERLEKLILSKSPSVSSDLSHRQQRLAAAPPTIRGLTVKGSQRTRFFGQNSTRVLLNLFDETKDFIFGRNKPEDTREMFKKIQKIHKTLQEEQRTAATPITVYVDSMTPILKRMADLLPKKQVCDQLVQVYFNGTESLYRILHIPSFMAVYKAYWEGNTVPDSFLPQILSIVCIGYRFICYNKGVVYDRDGIHVPTGCALVKSWLDSLRGKQLVDFGTLQTEILLLMAQRVTSPKDHEAWTQLGFTVRMAMTMGLHRDPDEFGSKLTPFWAEMRRRLWHTILELDVNVSLQCNLPSCVRDGDYTCRPPRNLNDEELVPDMKVLPESKPIDQRTDGQIQAYTASTLSLRFKVVDLVNRIDSIHDYQEILELGSELEKVFDDISYLAPRVRSSDNKEQRKQWSARVILDMSCRRAILGLYRPLALSATDVPQQIMTGYLRSSMALLGYLDDLSPASEGYEHTWHLHHLILRKDILQAAFSVCYYLKHISDTTVAPPTPSWSSHYKSDSIEEACTRASESSLLLAPSRLVAAVDQALTDLIRRMREIGTDMKDIMGLAICLATCQGGTPEQKMDAIRVQMRKILDAGLHAINTNEEHILSMSTVTTMPPTPLPMGSMQTPPGYMNTVPFMMQDMPAMMPDDMAIWDLEFWGNPMLQTSAT